MPMLVFSPISYPSPCRYDFRQFFLRPLRFFASRGFGKQMYPGYLQLSQRKRMCLGREFILAVDNGETQNKAHYEDCRFHDQTIKS